MQVVHWARFLAQEEDISALVLPPGQSCHVRILARKMVRRCLDAYPWSGRSDLAPLFDPNDAYQAGHVVALPLYDPQRIRPDSWRSGVVKSVQVGENARQGKFQVVQLVVDGKEHWLAAALEGAEPLAFGFPPDADEMDFLAEDLTNAYLPQLTAVIDGLIASGRLRAIRQDDRVIFGMVTEIKADFAPWFAECPPDAPYLTLDELILRLWDAGELTDVPEELARALVEITLRERGYMDVGSARWTTPEAIEMLDRHISRRLDVPHNRSKIKAQLGDVEELDADDFLDLPESARVFLKRLEVEAEPEEPNEPVSPQTWTPPVGPLKIPALSFLNLMQGYFPLNEAMLRAFPPRETAGLVDVILVEGTPLPCMVNLQERTLKSINPQAIYQRFVVELSIPAGTFLWLEFRGENQYRIAPRPMPQPKQVLCKQAWLEDDGSLRVEETEIPMRFDGDEHLFISEQRFEDMKALFREAEDRDFSIFDAIYDVLPKLAALRTDGLVHYNDIFNAVFFEYRMCSYRTVIHELYDHACFVEAGNGLYRFAPERGVRRRRPTRQQREKEFWQPQPVQDAPKAAPVAIEAEFWRQIATEIPRKLKTLDQEKPFEITSVTPDGIELVVSTGELRIVPRTDIEQAWEFLAEHGQIDRGFVRVFANFNVAYVLAILAQLPKVRYQIKPLRLILEKLDNDIEVNDKKDDDKQIEVLPPIRVERMRGGQLIAPDMLPPEPLFMAAMGIPTSGDVGVQLEPDEVQYLPILEDEPVDEQPAIETQADEIAEIETEQDDVPDEPALDYGTYPPGYPNSKEEFIEFLNIFKGQELLLQNYAYPLKIDVVDSWKCKIRFGAGSWGELSTERMFAAWQALKNGAKPGRNELREYDSNNSTYLFAILRRFPCVTVFVKHPRYHFLSYQPPAQPTPDERQTGSGQFAPEAGLGPESDREQDTIEAPTKTIFPSRKTHVSAPKGDDMQNKTLFSNNFMNTRLEGMPEWAEDPQAMLNKVRALWQKATRFGANWNEAQTEDEFIKPILALLGWSFVVQAKAGRGGQVTRPDYALFGDEKSKDEAYPHQGDDAAFYGRALAIAEAKHWGRPLSQKDASGRATWKAESNPSHQMVSYLNGTRTEWGILTNGRAWRLYSREVSSTASEFYEIDLGLLFDFLPENTEPSPVQLDDFKRWWLFFRREAFTRTTGAKSFVQRVHEGSTSYAREISDKLKELVFQEVMPEIAGGFVAYRRQQLGIVEETPEGLQDVYRASLSLLYKLLFLLYAEARSLLPMDNPDYRANSLTAIAEWAAEQANAQRRLSEATYATPHYEKLLALFRRIDHGDSALGIPEYNGGLFSPKSAANIFLEKHKLSDQAVARAVDILVRDAGQPVDYAFISVRNLGAIYEGLLENKLEVLDAAAGKVALVNDKGERKATGSYYTPDYIVEYIVRNTLDPILERRSADYAAAMESVTALRTKLLEVGDAATASRLRAELDEAERTAREAFLGIKVLDPAMGSGHFLVNAVDHLTDGIIQRVQTWHDANPASPWEWDPIQGLIEKVRMEIRQELETSGLPVDSRLNDDTALLMRLVMKRCIYGVDLNEMAVELARVSLWLHTFTVGAPLSFLDHHLRWGNSLIGTDVRAVEYNITIKAKEVKVGKVSKNTAKGRGEVARESVLNIQSSLFGGPFAGLLDLTAVMTEIAERADATLSDVRASAKAYDDLQHALTPYKQALNLWVSQYFGNENAKEFMELYGDDVLPAIRGERTVAEKYKTALANAQILRKQKRFFHWDLEFPEVFIDLRKRDWAENGGFDAVIGNPPYIRQETLDPLFKTYLAQNYRKIYSGVADIYVYFIGKGIETLRSHGLLGFITSGMFRKLNYGANIRNFLAIETALKYVVDFGVNQPFGDATTYPIVLITQKYKSHSNETLSYFVLGNEDKIPDVGKKSPLPIGDKEWSFVESNLHRLIAGWDASLKLVDFLDAPINRGVSTGLNKAFVVDKQTRDTLVAKDHKSGELIKPYVQGTDINAWYQDNSDTWLIFTRRGIDIDEYPAIKNYLVQFRDELEPRPSSLPSSHIWRGRKPGNYKWFEIQDSVEYYKAFETPRIHSTKVSLRPSFSFSEDVCYAANTSYILPIENSERAKFLLSILNSNVSKYYSQAVFAPKANGYYEVQPEKLEQFPIPRIDFATITETRATELDRARALYVAGEMHEIQALSVGLLARGQADVVHDLLVFLAGEMIAMNKSRQEEMKGFLAYLSREVRADLNDLTGKTTLFNYLGDYQKSEEPASLDSILGVLRKNQKKLGADVSSRAFQESLAREYESSLAKLRPIKSRLAAVDGLIDQVVYALYGLGDEEIAVIEGKG